MNLGQATFLGTVLLICVCCASQSKRPLGPKTLDDARKGVEVKHDRFKATTTVTGPAQASTSEGVYHRKLFLRTIKSDKLGLVTHQVYLFWRMPDWAFWASAYAEGERLKFVEIEREVQRGDVVDEHAAVNLSWDQMLEAARIGLDMRVYGSGREDTIFVDNYLFQAQVEALEREGIAPVTSSTPEPGSSPPEPAGR